ncbi:unnamed protein product [Rhizophagus irregularis]|nr:unnamed protein product [Rhizophagus irregularis]
MMNNNKHNFTPHSSLLFKFGHINVNGLVSPMQQQHLLNFFFHSSFGALSLNDTRLTSSSAKFIFKNEHHQHHFRSYWACSSSLRPHNGVDLFFHQIKISIISLYNPPSGFIHQNISKDLIAKLLSWLDHACSNNYHVVILGDFNIDEIAYSNYSHNHFRLLRLLSSRYFNDHQAYFSSLFGPDPTFYHTNGSSRLDYIWFSSGFPAPGLFTQVISCPSLFDRPFTDHRVLVTIFDFSSCMAILAKSRLKQKKELRTIFTYSSISTKQWKDFTEKADDILKTYLDKQYSSQIDFSSFSSLSLDRLWHALKAAIFGSAV